MDNTLYTHDLEFSTRPSHYVFEDQYLFDLLLALLQRVAAAMGYTITVTRSADAKQ